MTTKLYLVPTPVGNLEDITLRALRLLKEMDFILAEDTRQSRKLMNYYDIKTRLIPFHKFNEHKSIAAITSKIKSGEKAALISDAGTPGISDPGFLIVRECLKEGIEVECLPGATAFVPALVNSGLPSDHFTFEGFLPVKKGRNKCLSSLAEETRTMIFYESPFRLIKTLHDLASVFGEERQASVSRELTKIYEETIRGTISEILVHYKNKYIKGEIVIVVAGKS
jgi:16S rRNA (cytidine1402-2'-O)-methyltransferase